MIDQHILCQETKFFGHLENWIPEITCSQLYFTQFNETQKIIISGNNFEKIKRILQVDVYKQSNSNIYFNFQLI